MSSKHRFLALCAPVVAALLAVVPAPAANGRIAFADVTGIGSMNPDGSGQWGVDLGSATRRPPGRPMGPSSR